MAHTLEINSLKSLVTSLKEALEQKNRSQRRLNYLATHDVLTGLRNRYAFKMHIHSYFYARCVDRKKPLILLLLDMTSFKDVNDTLGHDIGDRVLQLIARQFKENLPEYTSIYRLGGDEFAILFQEPVGQVKVKQKDVLNKLLRVFNHKYTINNNRIRVGASIGICIAPSDAKSPQELFKRADIAMYEAKHSGKTIAYKFFDTCLEQKLNEKKQVEHYILDLIQSKQFDVYFQPKIDTFTGDITGMEALLRTKTKSQYLPALKIIEVAEENNLISSLGAIVIDKALDFLHELKVVTGTSINLALNISSLQINDTFIDKLESSLDHYNLDFSDITIEITEGLLISHPRYVRDRLKYFHSKGLNISIDDFGTGYSSLSYLHNYPFNELKIDRSFISDIEGNDIKKKIVIGIIQLAHALDLKVVAEGVETEAQFDFLKNAKCDFVQGHLFYPALPPEDILKIINSQNNIKIHAL